MGLKFNWWSFIFSFVCIALFYVAAFPTESLYFPTKLIPWHPLNLVLVITVLTFLFGIIGFTGVKNWKTLLRSIITLVLTSGLSLITMYIIFIGNLFNVN